MLERALPFTLVIAAMLPGCGSPTGLSGDSFGGLLGTDSCHTPLNGLKVEGPSRTTLKAGQTLRLTFDIGTPARGCTQRVGPFERLTWIWSGDRQLDMRLVQCPECVVEYTDKVLSNGGNDLQGSALIHGEQAVVFDVTRLGPGSHVVGVFAHRGGESSSAFVQVDMAR